MTRVNQRDRNIISQDENDSEPPEPCSGWGDIFTDDDEYVCENRKAAMDTYWQSALKRIQKTVHRKWK